MKTMPPHLQSLTTLLPQGIADGGDTELESNKPTDGMFEKRVMSHDWQITRDATVRIIEQTISIWSALGLFSNVSCSLMQNVSARTQLKHLQIF